MDLLAANLICVAMAVIFVGVLYLAPSDVANLGRNDPRQIVWRMYALCGVSIVCPIIIYFCLDGHNRNGYILLSKLGLLLSTDHDDSAAAAVEGYFGQVVVRWLFNGVVVPTIVTASLFLGPLLEAYYENIEFGRKESLLSARRLYRRYTEDMVAVRAYILAPIFEEWVFRACMIVVLKQISDPESRLSTGAIALYSPLYFGVAHLHHVYNMVYKEKRSWKSSLIVCFVQFLYTSLFGSYVAYVFCRTNNVYGIIIQHSFCNFMGLPQPVWFRNPQHYLNKYSVILSFGYIFGIASFYCLIQYI